jgi:hypothetical protein
LDPQIANDLINDNSAEALDVLGKREPVIENRDPVIQNNDR